MKHLFYKVFLLIGVTGLLFLLAVGSGKAQSLQENLTSPDNDFNAVYGNAVWNSQSFTAGSGYSLWYVKQKLQRNGTISDGVLTVAIYNAGSDDKPTGSALASDTMTPGDVDTTATWYEFDYTPFALTNGNKYAIVTHLTGTTSDYPSAIRVRRDNSDGLATGDYCQSTDTGSTWDCGGTADQLFEVWGEVGAGGGDPTTTPSTFTTSTVIYFDNPTDDVYHGLVLFFVAFALVIFYFKK